MLIKQVKIKHSPTSWDPSPKGLIPLGYGGSIPRSPGGVKEYTSEVEPEVNVYEPLEEFVKQVEVKP